MRRCQKRERRCSRWSIIFLELAGKFGREAGYAAGISTERSGKVYVRTFCDARNGKRDEAAGLAVILSKSGDAYKLYAREIIRHPLTAQLVTISACEGANGRAYSGEGLVGLSWAFLRSGAHNVVGALWK